MIMIPGPSGPYCIDSTEVTSAQYEAWLDTSPALPQQSDPLCGWNASYAPKTSGDCADQPYNPVNRPNRPVACVDWCDARAFCMGVGKRMCGAFGGGAVAWNDHTDPTKNEWRYACSAGGTKQFPYGDMYQSKTCVDDAYDGSNNDGAGNAVDVGSAVGCVGGFKDLRDMSGNVWEWEDACEANDDPKDDPCSNGAGSFWDDGPNNFICATSMVYHQRSSANKNVGFRCCADPK
jgi:formylglycine-generating enzyme required for sulfatase activity